MPKSIKSSLIQSYRHARLVLAVYKVLNNDWHGKLRVKRAFEVAKELREA